MRIVIGGTIVLLLVVAAILMWPTDHTPTLPDTGPGAKRVAGSALLPDPEGQHHDGEGLPDGSSP